jgi:hypothetical protein
VRRLWEPSQAANLDRGSPFLKAHMRDGRVYVLAEWEVDADGTTVSGTGKLLDANRTVVGEGRLSFPIDSVAIFETNRVTASPAVAAMAVITGASLALTAACAANPKMCFGSCPTFYVSDGEGARLQAEGFSASVSPALEARDIDALYRARPSTRTLRVEMRNEALETHVVRRADILAARRRNGGRVFVTQSGSFWEAVELAPPRRCEANEGECLAAVLSFDGIERFSESDSTNLAEREVIELEFASAGAGEVGLVIAARQTLLSTYVFYQALAYMGRSAGHWLAALERGDALAEGWSKAIGRILGGIEVLVPRGRDEWEVAGEINETGPLATDVRLVPLGHVGPGPLKVRLRLTRGLWRLDWIALARLGERVEPVRLAPIRVYRGGNVHDRALKVLNDPDSVLVTLPGDRYSLEYRLPERFSEYELFLDSKGYYLEWMREAWLADEDPTRAAMMFLDPEGALRSMAPGFKRVEPQMEELFWRSRYARP